MSDTTINSIRNAYKTVEYGLPEIIHHQPLLLNLEQHFSNMKKEKSLSITY